MACQRPGTALLAPLREALHAQARIAVVPDLVTASLGTRAGVIGAALLAAEEGATGLRSVEPGRHCGCLEGGVVTESAQGHVLALRGRVVAPDRVHDDGLVLCRDGRVEWVGEVSDAPPDAPEIPASRGWTLLPGLVDVHCHGGGGAGFPDADRDGVPRRRRAPPRRTGTTTLLGSLVSRPRRARAARSRCPCWPTWSTTGLAGIHLEGPFLSAARCGAQNPDALRDPATRPARARLVEPAAARPDA